jgi:hypothetical protein
MDKTSKKTPAEILEERVLEEAPETQKRVAAEMTSSHIYATRYDLIKRLEKLQSERWKTISVTMNVPVELTVEFYSDAGSSVVDHEVDTYYGGIEVTVPIEKIESTKEYKEKVKAKKSEYKKAKDSLTADAMAVIEQYASSELGFKGKDLKAFTKDAFCEIFDFSD